MGVAYNSKIVTDGLVLCLDAGNIKSYPGSGTTWTDLSGNGRNGTLTNMEIPSDYTSTNGGILTFGGDDEYAVWSGSAIPLTAATFIVWIKRGAATGQAARAGLIMSRNPIATGMNLNPNLSNFALAYHWNDDGATYSWNSGLIIPLNSWSMCALTVTSSLATGYLYQASGLTTATNSTSHGSTSMSVINVGRDAYESRPYLGSMAQALIYNRALTATEIRQNYLATKSRYFS